MSRAVFLDRDNTLIRNADHLGDPAGVVLLPGIAAPLVELKTAGYLLVMVSNQAGVARGYYDEAAVRAVNHEVFRQIRAAGGPEIDAGYYCPFHPEAPLPQYRAAHPWRKPAPGMLLQAAQDLSLDLPTCWMIGDQMRDVGAGLAAGCRTILLRDPDLPPARDMADDSALRPHHVVRTLAEAAAIVLTHGSRT